MDTLKASILLLRLCSHPIVTDGIWIIKGCHFHLVLFLFIYLVSIYPLWFHWVVCASTRDAALNTWMLPFDHSASRIWVSYPFSLITFSWVLLDGCWSILRWSALSKLSQAYPDLCAFDWVKKSLHQILKFFLVIYPQLFVLRNTVATHATLVHSVTDLDKKAMPLTTMFLQLSNLDLKNSNNKNLDCN